MITIPSAMQIDLGGLGKEYAADMAANVFYESNILVASFCTNPPLDMHFYINLSCL